MLNADPSPNKSNLFRLWAGEGVLERGGKGVDKRLRKRMTDDAALREMQQEWDGMSALLFYIPCL